MLLKIAETDEPELENRFTLCRLTRTQVGRDFITGRGEDLRVPSDADIAARAEAGIRAEFPSLLAPLPALAMVRPPRQRRYIIKELKTV